MCQNQILCENNIDFWNGIFTLPILLFHSKTFDEVYQFSILLHECTPFTSNHKQTIVFVSKDHVLIFQITKYICHLIIRQSRILLNMSWLGESCSFVLIHILLYGTKYIIK